MIAALAVAMIFMRLVDVFWLVTPAFHSTGFHIHWMDLAAFVGMGGLWVAVFVWQLKGWPLLPLYDPRLEESLHGVRESLHHG